MKTGDLWRYLSHSDKPVVLYGTGDGADKIADVLAARGVSASGYFASDGFVRSRSFRGLRVMSYDEAAARFPDMVVLVAFGSALPEVAERVMYIARRHETYIPDVPVAGDELFDLDYYNAHRAGLDAARAMLSWDERSAAVIDDIVSYKLSGDPETLMSSADASLRCELDISPRCRTYCECVDVGAYTGDSVRRLAERAPALSHVTALEPDPRSFGKLKAFAAEVTEYTLDAINAAAWDCDTIVSYDAKGGRGSSVSARGVDVRAISVDSLGLSRADLIKIDAEGSEERVLAGAGDLIRRCAPDLLVAAYHRSGDLHRVPALIRELRPDYRMTLRRLPCIPAWELYIYASAVE